MLSPVAETTVGALRGATDKGVHVFKGVRYGDSTGGANRFRPPRPVTPWAGVRDALAWGPAAPQFAVPQNTDPFYAWYSAIQPISEDCLALNVFSPGLKAGRRPVLFWIHGGGWREFSGSAPGFDGRNLARQEDVVVVTINHRLSAFGFFPADGADERFADAGNAGLLDIVQALAWVRDNIAAFGGDPGNVTIFGESGGASKIAALLAMRAASGLFHKAILQSSAGGMRLATPEDMARAARELAVALGRDRVDCASLQALPMDTLVAALKQVTTSFRGMIDGRSFDADPYFTRAPAISAHIPVMAGCTNTEATYHLRMAPGNFALDRDAVRQRLARLLLCDEDRAQLLLAHYAGLRPEASPSVLMEAIATDYIFKRNTYRIAELQAETATAPVFAYLFRRESAVENGTMRSPHTCELPFIFGTAETAEACVGPADAADVAAMTRRMMATWAAFARSGNPNNPTVPAWQPYRPGEAMMMVLDEPSHLARDPGGAERAGMADLPYFGYHNPLGALIRP